MLEILKRDAWLQPFESDLHLRMNLYEAKRRSLLQKRRLLSNFANGHEYFGLHIKGKKAVFREWAPGAKKITIYGDFNGWNKKNLPLTKKENGIWEIEFPEEYLPKHGDHYKFLVTFQKKTVERIPSYARYVVQDPETKIWSAKVFCPTKKFRWEDENFSMNEPPVIYECHIGMATEEYRVGTYEEFRKNRLRDIKKGGYNTIQLMAVMEHPYYASFGYQVSNFFAASSRYGTPDEFKALVNDAHKMGIRVLLDLVHSHAVVNEVEGLNRFDGTDYQYFHEGERGMHPAWKTKLFNYDKNEVLHFLLSNLKFWLTEYHLDGFRFDGVTSMIYKDHGLGVTFDSYQKYFSLNTDTEAVTYLMLANELIHSVKKDAVTIAEDMSGMPGMCLPIEEGGIGFDYRLAMGVPDLWIRLLKEKSDEDWSLSELWNELQSHRDGEKVISYAESHDQALVGDKTIMFRLADSDMYWFMGKNSEEKLSIDRAMALHKMIRMITFTQGGNGYLNFMGNEFGHPEWVDFPREGNQWSYHYARRQWSLRDSSDLKFEYLNAFDKKMINEGKKMKIFNTEPENLWMKEDDQVLITKRGGRIFAFNFNPRKSFTGYFVPTKEDGIYRVCYSTDEKEFGGQDRLDPKTEYKVDTVSDQRKGFFAYLPARTAICFEKMKKQKITK